MYIELTSFDSSLSGVVDESQLTLVALRYDVPLKAPVLKALIKKFSGKNTLFD